MKKNDNILHPHILVSSVFNSEEIEKINSLTSKYDLHYGRTGADKSITRETIEKVRISEVRFFKRSDEATFETGWIFDRLDDVIKQVNESRFDFQLHRFNSFQYTTYDAEKAGRYNWHMDSFTGRSELAEKNYPRKLSMSVFLNDDFEGGEFEICTAEQSRPVKFKTVPGDAIVFPSFMIHRVTEVTKGIRKSLVVWVEGPRWK